MGHLPRCQKSSPGMANAHLRRPAAKPSVWITRKCKRDGLSALPDDILVNILDRLDVRSAARTSILSRRWTQLFTKLSRLIINAQDFLPKGVSIANISGDDLVGMNAAAVEATMNILTCRNSGEHTVRLLSTTFYLKDDVPISIGHAVGKAMATHKIEKAEFTVLTEYKARKKNYGAHFVSFFNECLHAFTGLTSLHLENLIFAESDVISNILSTCKQLKYLSFSNCATESWTTLQVEHAQLSDLSFSGCRIGEVELKWLPRLTRTKFEWLVRFKELRLSFGHVPLLEVVSLTNIALSWHKMVMLSTLLYETSVRDLRLDFKCEKIWVQPECLTKRLSYAFRRLSVVNLVCIPEGYDLTWTMFILEAAPSLQEYYMMVFDHPCEMEMDEKKRRQQLYSKDKGVQWESPTSNFKHHHLTTLIIFCFESSMVSHVRRVMEAAVNLKDVYLYSRLACGNCMHLEPGPSTFCGNCMHLEPGPSTFCGNCMHLKPGLSTFPRSIKKKASTKKLITQGIESHARIHLLHSSEMSDYHALRMQ